MIDLQNELNPKRLRSKQRVVELHSENLKFMAKKRLNLSGMNGEEEVLKFQSDSIIQSIFLKGIQRFKRFDLGSWDTLENLWLFLMACKRK